jgi:putative N6-adenine-specific DNA methylase
VVDEASCDDAGRRVKEKMVRRDCFAVVAPGLEALAAAELRTIGIAVATAESGGVGFSATDAELFAANFHARTISRIIVRVAEFRATAFHDLEKIARTIAWDTIVAPKSAIRLRVTCKKSKLYHSDAVAQRVFDAMSRRVTGVTHIGAAKSAGGDPDDDDAVDESDTQLFVVRFMRDVCTISADSSGALLHRRGYRLATAKAPLRETLAASLLLGARWNATTPLLDPMCGSGTIAIEAAMLARRIPPGTARMFACERWPAAPATEFAAVRHAAAEWVLEKLPVAITASDRDEGAITASLANAARAGVQGDIEFGVHAISGVGPQDAPGMVVVNPPYGARVGAGAGGELRNLYAQLGNVLRANRAGWMLAMISADKSLESQVKMKFTEALKFKNGGIPVRLVVAEVPSRG